MRTRVGWFRYAMALTVFLRIDAVHAGDETPCSEDAMIVFDASGSMSGNGWGYGSETVGTVSRIDKVRATLAKILPTVTRFRRVGLITYGTGAWNQCNVHLDLPPTENATTAIMAAVDKLVPAGKTPLTAAVAQAADVLDFRAKPGLIVVLTDGEETCGGSPCGLGKRLSTEAAQLTVHVISLRVKGLTWMGEQSILEAKCLAETNRGLYLRVDTPDELLQALDKTLGCPMVTKLHQEPISAPEFARPSSRWSLRGGAGLAGATGDDPHP
jgi:Ca-activated chloride channel family protein